MKKHIYKAILFIPILPLLQVCFSCNTSPLLTKNVHVNTQEIKELEKEAKRPISPQITYLSNIENFEYPSQQKLLHEANIKNQKMFDSNVTILSDWILKDLSTKHRIQLSKNCNELVGSFVTEFPLNDTTIACAAWWIEKRNSILLQNKITSNKKQEPTAYMTEEQKKNWYNFKDLTIIQTLPLIDISTVEKKQLYLQKVLLHATDCSLKNANAAFILKLENYLPSPSAYQDIEKVYTKMQPCLIHDEEPSEKIHLRIGLLRLLQGHTDLAFDALKRTQLETDPKENSRSLFWLGVIYKKKNPIKKDNPYWQKLIKENPLALSSLVASQQMGIDPTSILVQDKNIPLQNRTDEGWTKENLETFIFDLLRAHNKYHAAFDWANYVTQAIDTTNPNLILYWAYTQNKLHNYHRSIQLFFRYTNYKKAILYSPGLLSLQFPSPYLQDILQSKSVIDPIFILALIRQESAFNEKARSSVDARGLMQILPTTAKTIRKYIRPDDLYDPTTSIEIGDEYLKRLFYKYKGKSEYVLAAYNAGAINVDKWLSRVPSQNIMLFCDFIPYKETRSYVSIILRNYYWYTKLFDNNKNTISHLVLQKRSLAQYTTDRVQALLGIDPDENKVTSNFFSKERSYQLLNSIYIFNEISQNNVAAKTRGF